MTDRALSPEILENHVGIMGKTGSGKSNLAKVVAEQLLAAGQRVCILDPTGTWYGLRLTRGRKPSPYQVVIFGGAHGDLPIAEHHGAEIAAALARSTTSAIIDTRAMSVGARTKFSTAFAETLLQRNAGRLYVIVDEAHLFAPQGRSPDVEGGKMVHAWNNLASLGRGIGLVLVLISQRPAKLHKDALTQVETLVAMRLIAPQDVGAVKDWIGEWAGKDAGGEVIRSLPALPTGTGWVWSPQLNVLEQRKFPLTSVLDTGKPSDETIELAPIDTEALRAQLGRVEEERKANDPAELRREIARLRAELDWRPPQEQAIVEKIVEVPVLNGQVDHLGAMLESLVAVGEAITSTGKDILAAISRVQQTPTREREERAPRGVPAAPARDRGDTAVATLAPAAPRRDLAPDSPAIGKAERAILAALGSYPTPLTREQLAFLAGYHPRTPGFVNAVGKLRTAGYITSEYPASITAEGAGLVDPLPGQTIDLWLSRFGKAERLILEHLFNAYPDSMERQALADAAGYHPRTPGFVNALGKLRGLGLVDGFRIADDFARLVGR